jgi:broad specificity phosphatase PhoE
MQQFPSVTLLLIRHGQQEPVEGRVGRLSPLSAKGCLEADLLAATLASGPALAAVYSSPLPRAHATAEAICRRTRLTPNLDSRLMEFEMGHKSVGEIAERGDLLIWRPEHRAADGETLAAFSRRVANCCDEIATTHPQQLVVVVAHAGTIDAAMRWALGIDADAAWQQEMEVQHASICEVEVWPRGRISGGAPRHAVVRRVNDTGHLGALVTDL